jgi:hypothetical protein
MIIISRCEVNADLGIVIFTQSGNRVMSLIDITPIFQNSFM